MEMLRYPNLDITYMYIQGMEPVAKINFEAEAPINVCRELGNERDPLDKIRWLLGMPVSATPKKVIFHDPATIIYWKDGTKTVVKCDERDTFSKESGLSMCYMKKMLGSSLVFNDALKEFIHD